MIFLAMTLAVATIAIDDPKPVSDKDKTPKVIELLNAVEGRTVILSLVPEGSTVKKGQTIGELDSAGFRNDLLDQQIIVKQAEADVVAAKSGREIAESEAKEISIVVAREIAQCKERIKLAETGVAVASAKLEEAKKAKMNTQAALAEKAKAKADQNLKIQEQALKTLQETAGPKRIQQSDNKVVLAKADEAVKAVTLTGEQAREKKLREQIEHCKLIAPAAGMLIYANPNDGRPDPPPIEEGATVRERQALVRIVPQ